MKNEPWTCPVCGAGVAPWVEKCVHPKVVTLGGQDIKQDDGWIEWVFNFMPQPLGIVDLKFRNGDVLFAVRAHDYGWQQYGKGGDIIAYRVVRP